MTPPSTATATKRGAATRAPKRRVQRRVSGPAPAVRPTSTARAAAAPPIPRRRQPVAKPALGPFAERALGVARTLRDSQAVDRLVRGRMWIGILGVLLIGLVGLNVSLLKLNAAAGRNAEWAKKLRVENADLRARVSRLHSGTRIQAKARQLGYVMPAASDVHYLSVNPERDARRAAKRESLTPQWNDDDIVNAAPDPAPVVPVAQIVPAPAGATGAVGATGAAGTTGTAAPAVSGTTGMTGTTGTGGTTGAATTGATVP